MSSFVPPPRRDATLLVHTESTAQATGITGIAGIILHKLVVFIYLPKNDIGESPGSAIEKIEVRHRPSWAELGSNGLVLGRLCFELQVAY